MDIRVFSECFGYVLFLCTITEGRLLQDGTNAIDKYKGQNNIVHRLLDGMDISLERHKRSTTSGLVDISRFVDTRSAATGSGHPQTVYVDDTMTRLLFHVAVERSKPIIAAKKPGGGICSVHPSFNGSVSAGTVVATMDIPILVKADYGVWKFAKLDGNIWDVTIKAESPVYIKQHLFENGTNIPITGAPVVGKDYRVKVEVMGFSHISSIDTGMLFAKSISPASFIPLVSIGGGRYEADSVTMSDKPFMVGIQGKDKSGNFYRRIDPTKIKPVTVSLDVSPYTDTTVFEYSLFNITFTVTNLLSTVQDVDIGISDSRNYTQAPTTISATLKVGENYTDTFVIKSEFAGLTTLVKITARQHLGNGKFIQGPEELRKVKVITNQTTTTAISTMPTSITTTHSIQAVNTVMSSNSSTLPGTISNSTQVYTSGGSNTSLTRSNRTHTGVLPSITTVSSSTSQHGVLQVPGPGKSSITSSRPPNVVAGSTDKSRSRSGSSGSQSESDSSSTKIEISAGAIVASMLTGTIVGVAAIVTMGVIFKKAMTKTNTRVVPAEDGEKEQNRSMTSEEAARSENAQFLYHT